MWNHNKTFSLNLSEINETRDYRLRLVLSAKILCVCVSGEDKAARSNLKSSRFTFCHIQLTLILKHFYLQLEKRLEQEKQERFRKEQEMAAAKQNGLSIMSNGSDDFRPRILQRPKPVVTILKRPDSSPALSSTSQNSKPQIKTLEQREKEYAEARLRILGSAAASDECPTDQK